MCDIDLTDKSSHARVNPQKTSKEKYDNKTSFCGLLLNEKKNVKSHYKRMVRSLCMYVIYYTRYEWNFDAFLTPSGNIIVYLIYGKSFHILSTEDQKGFCIPLGLRGKKYLNNIRLLIFDSIHIQGSPCPRRTFLFHHHFVGTCYR